MIIYLKQPCNWQHWLAAHTCDYWYPSASGAKTMPTAHNEFCPVFCNKTHTLKQDCNFLDKLLARLYPEDVLLIKAAPDSYTVAGQPGRSGRCSAMRVACCIRRALRTACPAPAAAASDAMIVVTEDSCQSDSNNKPPRPCVYFVMWINCRVNVSLGSRNRPAGGQLWSFWFLYGERERGSSCLYQMISCV